MAKPQLTPQKASPQFHFLATRSADFQIGFVRPTFSTAVIEDS
jgi:hypothetical protein